MEQIKLPKGTIILYDGLRCELVEDTLVVSSEVNPCIWRWHKGSNEWSATCGYPGSEIIKVVKRIRECPQCKHSIEVRG